MPTALREGPYRFFFYSFDCNEPVHVHVERDKNEAKFWLDPLEIEFTYFPNHETRKIRDIILDNHSQILEAWYEHCGHR